MLPVFVALVRGCHTFIDVGANIGWYTLVAKAANPRCRVIAFEPCPQLADTLERNLKLNGMDDVVVERAAVGDVDGEVDLYVSPSDSSTSTLQGFRKAVATIRVRSVTLDAYVRHRELREVDLVKVDVEGADDRVLRGMCELLRGGRTDVFCEVLKRIEAEIQKVLERFPGYHLYWVTPEGLVPKQRVVGDSQFSNLNYLFSVKTPDQLRAAGVQVVTTPRFVRPPSTSSARVAPREQRPRIAKGPRVLLYCDADLNLIDGSAIWTASVAQVLALDPDIHVTLLLKRALGRSLLTAPLEGRANVELLDPFARAAEFSAVGGGWEKRPRLQPGDAARLIADLDRRRGFDLVLVRGLRLCQAVVSQPSLAGRIWAYLTDFTDENRPEVAAVYAGASRLLCQTPQLRDHIKQMVGVGEAKPAAADKFILLPPMIPDMPGDPPSRTRQGEKLVYVGKFAPLWRTEEMVEVMAEIRSRHPGAELHVAGDKIHDVPGFSERMRQLLEQTEGLIWHQGLSREQTQELINSCDLGCSWRHPDLDTSLELSTKVLEYGSCGKPALLNRTPMHEELLGADYPLFCNTRGEYLAAVSRAFEDDRAYTAAAERAWEASCQFTFSAALARLAPHLLQPTDRTPAPGVAAQTAASRGTERRTRVALASHDWKFFGSIMSHLQGVPDFEVRVDEWSAIREHDERLSRELAEWADVVVAEWCFHNAIWYSRHLRPGCKLLVRLHRIELHRAYPELLNQENVHAIVTVSPAYAEGVRARMPSLRERVVYVPNAVDCAKLDQPKVGGEEFRLGLLGYVPRLKRFDLALDIFETLRRRDRRYTLWVKGKPPPDHPWIWQDAEERRYYEEEMARINTAEWRDSVVFDPFGADVPGWFRKIGFIVSSSDIESFHLAVAEGMASGAVPVIRRRDEVPDLYPAEYIFSDVREAVHIIERVRAEREGIMGHSASLKAYVRDRFDAPKVAAEWEQLIRRLASER